MNDRDDRIPEQTAQAPDPGLLLTALSTEHFTLQGARSQTMSESSARASVYVFSLSSTLVALGFIGQLDGVGTAFYVFALTVLPALYLLGAVTFVRLVECGAEDFRYGMAINRIRHYYKELAGDRAGPLPSLGTRRCRGRVLQHGPTACQPQAVLRLLERGHRHQQLGRRSHRRPRPRCRPRCTTRPCGRHGVWDSDRLLHWMDQLRRPTPRRCRWCHRANVPITVHGRSRLASSKARTDVTARAHQDGPGAADHADSGAPARAIGVLTPLRDRKREVSGRASLSGVPTHADDSRGCRPTGDRGHGSGHLVPGQLPSMYRRYRLST
jgi:hypothetical protein